MELSLQNPWWKNPKAIEDDEKVKEALSKENKIIYKFNLEKNKLILGPRQVGKTTMLKLLSYDLIMKKKVNPKNILYFSCEPLNEKKELIDLFSEFNQISAGLKGKKYIFLDETTQIKDWELAIKYFLETKLHENKLLIATGSNAFLLKKGSERLPGRNMNVKLFLPLTFREFLLNFSSKELKLALKRNHSYNELTNLNKLKSKAINLLPFLDELNAKLYFYLKTGGYLKPVYEFLEKNRISEETYEIYVKWILGDLSKLDKRESIFKSMVKGIVKNYCSKFSLLSFAKEMEIPSHVTVSEYLEALQSLLLINNLYQADLNKQVPIFRKERKCYFMDPFLYSVFKGYSLGKYQDYSEGFEDKLLEGIICEILARLNRQNLDISNFLWFYVKKKETDFVIKVNGELLGVELKFQDKVEKKNFSNFYSFKKKILLSKKDFKVEDNLLILPVSLFLALLGNNLSSKSLSF
jgi:hypothetical protein